jgi:glutamine synthetase adenylyltransferase
LAPLRRFKRRETSHAWRRHRSHQPVETVVRQIHLADAIVEAAVDYARHHLELQCIRSDRRRAELLCVLGLGKLGGVNSTTPSDIDPIFLYEQDGQTNARRTVTNQST